MAATVIDSLVVELNLDSSKFTREQQRALQNLRAFEQQAGRASQRTEMAAGENVIGFFRQIERPFASLRGHFETLARTTGRESVTRRNLAELGQTGARTGRDIETGALAGAAGLRALGVAGLTAFAAVSGLQKLLGALGDTANKVFPQGVSAFAAGMSVEEISTWMRALSLHGAVPMTETSSFLVGLGGLKARAAQFGQTNPDALRVMALAGIDPFNDSPAVVAQKFQRFASQSGVKSEDLTILANALGASPTLTKALKEAGGNFPAYLEEGSKYATTKRDAENAQKLLEAQNKLGASWDKLWRVIANQLDPTLEELLGVITKIIDFITGSAGGTGTFTAAGAEEYNKMMLEAGPAQKLYFKTLGRPESVKAGDPIPPGYQPGAGGSVPNAPMSGAPAAPPGGIPPVGAAGEGDPGDAAMSSDRSARFDDFVGSIFGVESRFGMRYNNAPYEGHAATGPMQIIPSTWNMYARPGERIDNYDDNMRVGRRILADLWRRYNGDIDKIAYSYANGSPSAPDRNPGYVAAMRRYLRIVQAQRAHSGGPDVGVPATETPAPSSSITPSHGLPDVLTLSGGATQPADVIARAKQYKEMGLDAQSEQIRRWAAQWHGPGAIGGGDQTMNMHGDINIHAPSNDPAEIARTTTDALRSTFDVNAANNGLIP